MIIVKIEEGDYPPYITNTGKIYSRVSSGSFPIEDSNKLNQLYYKRQDSMFINKDGFSYVLQLPFIISKYRDLYKEILGDYVEENFIEVKKYEKLVVLKQFKPLYQINENDMEEVVESAQYNYNNHIEKIVSASKNPYDGFNTVSREDIEEFGASVEDILFDTVYKNMGYIDEIKVM